MRKFPGSPKISTILRMGRKGPLPFLDVCLSFIEAFSLVLEPWMGICFILAALMPPRYGFPAYLMLERWLKNSYSRVNDLLVMVIL